MTHIVLTSFLVACKAHPLVKIILVGNFACIGQKNPPGTGRGDFVVKACWLPDAVKLLRLAFHNVSMCPIPFIMILLLSYG
jgi:hypothetical protein